MATSSDLVLRPNCVRCGAAGDLFAASCRHMTLCIACGRAMADADAPCTECGTPVKKLLKEYKVKKSTTTHKQYFVGRFPGGLPPLSDKSGVRWSMRKDIPRPADPAREKFKIAPDRLKNKPWILEDDTGSHQYQGQLEGAQQAIYYVLAKHGKEFMATPVNSWFNFHKAVQYKQLTLEEAEEHMKNRRKTADGYRWMMRATNGADAGNSRKGNGGEEDGDGKKDKKKPAAKADDEDEDLVKPEDFDEEEAVERGDDWEHEETFTDDDEAVGNDPEEREDQGPDVPAPPEMKQEEDDMEAEEGQTQEAGGLSQSGRDMKKLLGKSGGLEESDGNEEDEEDEDVDLDDDMSSPVLAPQNAKVEPAEAAKPAQTTARATASSAQKKRKAEDTKAAGPSSNKKNRSSEVKREAPATTTAAAAPSGAATKPAEPATPSAAAGPVTEEELKALLKRTGPQKSQDLVSRFRSRLKTPDEKAAFAAALKKISKIQKKEDGAYIVLK